MKTTTLTAVFTHFDNSSNWVHGICGEYNFDAKLFDDGSQFGINNGRVSKLSIAKYNGSPDVNYDRGWDIKPSQTVKSYYDAIMGLLENSPKRFA